MSEYTNTPSGATNADSNADSSGTESTRNDTGAYLGSIAKSASANLPVTEGKKTVLERDKNSADSVVWRYVLQSQARRLLPAHRVGDCARKIIPTISTVKIVREKKDRNRVGYRNLIKCGLLWACPVCASKITEKRSQELQSGVARWHAEDGFVIFATYTMQHGARATLGESLGVLQTALRRFKSGREYQGMIDRYGIEGTVKALEITYGDNGWHPHIHELIFVRPLSVRATNEFIKASRNRWIMSLRAVGGNGEPSIAYNAKTANSDVYDYVTKFGKQPTGKGWTIEREMVKAPAKLARRDGLTPFQMLEASMTDKAFEALFVEYVQTMHGARQLVWSKGLKEKLGIDDQTDEKAAADDSEDESPYDVLAVIEAADWYYMLNSGRFADVRPELLKVAATGDGEAVRKFIDSFYENNRQQARKPSIFDKESA